MELKRNKELRNKRENFKHYRKSDGSFMPAELSIKSHEAIPRLAWVAHKVEENKWKSILDVGCKDGYLTLTLSAMGISATGIDIARDAIKEAQRRASKLRLQAQFQAIAIEDYITDDHYDALALLEVMDRVVDPKEVLSKCSRLADNILISTPNYYGRFGWNDKKRNTDRLRIYKEEELKELCKSYGNIEEFDILDSAFIVHISVNKNGKKAKTGKARSRSGEKKK